MDGSFVEKAQHRPEWLRRRERGSASVIRLAVWLALAVGRSSIRLFLPPICLYFLIFSATSRAASRDYLGRALGRPAGLADIFRHYRSFASCVLDRVFFLKDRTELFDLRIFGEDIVSRIVAEGSGCVLLGAHLGSFEALRSVGRSQPGLRVKVVMFEENAQKITTVLNAINPELAKDVISLGKPDSFITVQRSLDSGAFVGLLADRSLNDKRRSPHSFLGAPASFSTDPFRMIAFLRKPVVLMVALYRGGNRYDIHFESLAGPDDLSRKLDAGSAEGLIGRYVARLEHYCRLAPYNWFNFYNFWD